MSDDDTLRAHQRAEMDRLEAELAGDAAGEDVREEVIGALEQYAYERIEAREGRVPYPLAGRVADRILALLRAPRGEGEAEEYTTSPVSDPHPKWSPLEEVLRCMVADSEDRTDSRAMTVSDFYEYWVPRVRAAALRSEAPSGEGEATVKRPEKSAATGKISGQDFSEAERAADGQGEAPGEITDADRVRAGLLRCYCGIPVSRGVSVSGWYETDGERHTCPLVRRAARWSEREGHV